MDEYLSTRDVVDLLEIHEWQVESAIRRGKIARPPVIGGARVWTWDLVERLADALDAVGGAAGPAGTVQ